MADQPSIFNNTEGNPPQNGVPANTNANVDAAYADLLANIKNERGEPKYKDVQEALNGLKNAQEYIPTLKQTLTQKEEEIVQLRATSERVKELERTLEALTSKGERHEPTTQTPVTPEAIADLVNRALTQRETVAVQESNVKAVVQTMKELFGTDAEKKFYDKAAELGLSVAEFNSLAAKSPKAVLEILGVKNTQRPNNSGAPTQGTVNTAALQPNTESLVGRNSKITLVGSTTQDLMEENKKAKGMVDELHKQGLTVHDLTDPKVYFKHFSK
jgi:hypothetical protein